jgi:hypothetical protein
MITLNALGSLISGAISGAILGAIPGAIPSPNPDNKTYLKNINKNCLGIFLILSRPPKKTCSLRVLVFLFWRLVSNSTLKQLKEREISSLFFV